MGGFWRRFGALCCVLVLAGCGVLSGRSSTETRRSGGASQSAAAVKRPAAAAFVDDHTVSTLFAAAEHDFEVIFTYDYRNLPKYRNAGVQVTTGSYTNTYSSALLGKPADRLKAGKFVEVASATEAGLADLSADHRQAEVVVSGTITTTSASNPAGKTTSATATLKMKLVGRTWRIANSAPGAAAQGSVPANAAMRKAMAAARTALTRIYGLRRKTFKSDYAKAVSLTTDTLHGTMTENETQVRQTLTSGNYDLSAKIVGFSVLEPRNGAVPVILALDEYHLARQGTRLGPYRHVFLVSVSDDGGAWRVSSATPVT